MTRIGGKACGLCHVILEVEAGPRRQQLEKHNGLKIEVGYSLGGWGQRQDRLNFADEVCLTCYGIVMSAVGGVIEAIDRCRGPEETQRRARMQVALEAGR